MLHLRRHSKINLSMLDETLKSTHTSLDGVRKRTAACCRLVRAISSDQGRYGTAAEARSANLTLLTLTPAAHLHIHLYVYIYTHMYMCVYVCVYIYLTYSFTHMYVHVCRPKHPTFPPEEHAPEARRKKTRSHEPSDRSSQSRNVGSK